MTTYSGMTPATIVGAKITGHVPHHAGHVLYYDDDGDPVYCDGHDVTGTITDANQSKLYIKGTLAVVVGGSGPSTDPCDGSDFEVVKGSSSIFVQGVPLVLNGGDIRLNPGEGTIIDPFQDKYYSRR